MKDFVLDRRHHYYMVLDTETCGNFGSSLTYDIGYAIVSSKGNVVTSRSFVVNDIFFKEKRRMHTAYYADKLPQYFDGIPVKWSKEFFGNIHRCMKADIERYNVIAIVAHNASFDVRALNYTCDFLFGIDTFFDFGIPVLDTLKMSKQLFATMPTYIKYCEENDFMTKRNTPRYKAETIYSYLMKNPSYEE